MINIFSKSFQQSEHIRTKMSTNPIYEQMVEQVVHTLIECLKSDQKIRFCGNGGSAADAQHIAAELSGRFYIDRPPLDAEALHVNPSYVTAVANDYSFDSIYERMVVAQGKAGDVLVGISTSGNSKNVLLAMKKAKEIGMKTVALTGEGGGKIAQYADYLIDVPSKDTPRIQEVHILIGHIICEMVEKELFGQS